MPDREAGESISGKIGPLSLAARGPLAIILMSIYLGIAADLWFEWQGEGVRRVVEQEARAEVILVKATQSLLVQSVARYCGVPGLDQEVERIAVEYRQRLENINQQRDKLGIPRIGGTLLKGYKD